MNRPHVTGSRSGWGIGDVSERALGVGGVVALVVLSVVALATAVTPKLVAISWVAFAAMAVGAPLGARAARTATPRETVWGYGLASGAMVTSTALFLIPQALGQHGRFGSLGIAAGFLAGYAGHAVGHRLTHRDLPIDRTAAELTAHALAAGAIIGAIYAAMPSLTSILPAAAVGLVALPVGIVGIAPSPVVRGLLFGAAAGVFLHVAVDLLPECTAGSDTCPVDAVRESDEHRTRDRLRAHAAGSAIGGGVAVALAWALVAVP